MRWDSGYSLIGLVVLVLSILAIVEIFKSGRPMSEKLLWTVLILVFPIVGLIIYYFFGRAGGPKV